MKRSAEKLVVIGRRKGLPSGHSNQTSGCTIEQMVDELCAAGWKRVRGNVWKAPVGGYFLGPYGAWLTMRRKVARELE